jgi:O-antigen/teichoic acid export membrane protein
VTYYSFGFMLIDYGRTMVALLPQQILKPATEKAAGVGATTALRWYFLIGSRMIMFLTVPLLVGYLVLGRQFLLLWLEEPSFERSAVVLSLLTLSQFWAIPSETARAVLQAVGQVRKSACVMIVEAAANVLLSVVLVMRFDMGLVGVALGTAIPMALLEGLALPAVACSAIGFPVRSYVIQVVTRWLVGALLLLPPAWLVAELDWGGWAGFAGKVAVVLTVYAPIGWFVVLGAEERATLTVQRRLAAAEDFVRPA